MDIDQEIKNLIDEYVKKIEDKEAELTLFKKEIEQILSDSKEELVRATANLDAKFNDNNITEEEYLAELREEKEVILKNTKERLDLLVQGLSTDMDVSQV